MTQEMIDSLRLGERIVDEYAADLLGGARDALAAVQQRLVLDPERGEQEFAQAIARMRGPYLQALSTPRWSDRLWPEFARDVRGAFAPNGLVDSLIELLTGRGFRRLHTFQEDAMRAVLADKDVLITAATGRGKTESWLIPILQYALLAKDGVLPGEPTGGTKALLVYPTKALAQDQLRRLIRYLVPINRGRPRDRRITVGIFDGDTPDGSRYDDADYLYQAFRLFDCPVTDVERCADCSHSLAVEPRGSGTGRLTLTLPEDDCEKKTPLDFVVLTRRDMVRETPDILITNPDMLHLRLMNVNDHAWRKILVQDPRFLVLDEIHTYAGIFGASVSWVVRRLRAARANAGIERPLRLIGASATVANGPDMFARLAGLQLDDLQLVNEETVQLSPIEAPPEKELPPILSTRAWHKSDPVDWSKDGDLALALGGPLAAGDNESLGEQLFARLVPHDVSDQLPPALALVRWFHRLVQEEPRTEAELVKLVEKQYSKISPDGLRTLVDNVRAVATLGGLLESRAHLFAWPSDGYYICASCAAIFLEPRSTCQCGGTFITRLVTCSVGRELSAEGWVCPVCLSVYQLFATVDGQYVAYEPPLCAAHHESVCCVRTVWRLYGRCAKCGTLGKHDESCSSCGESINRGEQGVVVSCTQCGSPEDVGPCVCGGMRKKSLHLPWICGRCGALAMSDGAHPSDCSHCGSDLLLFGGLVEVRVKYACDVCSADYLGAQGCEIAGHSISRSFDQSDRYMLVDNLGRLRQPTQFRGAVPCYHRGASYLVHRRYESLSRSPANVAVTSAQAALRAIAAGFPSVEEGAKQAKVLSFSDSQADMEQLARDFNDPEVDTFVDQAIFGAVANQDLPMQDVMESVARAVPSDMRRSRTLSGIQLQNRVLARFIRGSYRGRLGPQTLARDGLIDLAWDSVPDDSDAAAVLTELIGYNGQSAERMRRELDWSGERLAAALKELERGNWASNTNGILRLQPDRLLVRKVGPQAPMARHAQGRFILTAYQQLAPDNQAVLYSTTPEARSDPRHAEFSRAARRMLSTDRPMILTAATYKGSTLKKDRRQLEHAFSRLARPNFLSSGPAMEVGIDIGELDRVILYGTPPNINAYLQRVGRAGRRSKQALIFSVSKRNPIDLYYYQQPKRLIQSAAQPVPLYEQNERVLEVALTSAVADFVAGSFSIPWKREGAGVEEHVWCEGEPVRLPSIVQHSLTWLQLQNQTTDSVDESALVALDDLSKRHAHDAKTYLRELLRYSVCNRCGRTAALTAVRCQEPSCGGKPEPAPEKFDHLASDAVALFGERLVWPSRSVVGAYRTRKRELKQRSLDLEDTIDAASGTERTALRQQARQVDAELALILQLEEAAGQASLRDNQDQSEMARYGGGIRGAETNVAVELVTSGPTGQRVSSTTRDIGPALREHAPGALTLQNTDEFITLAVLEHSAQTLSLRRRLNELTLPALRGCRHCCRIADPTEATCAICDRGTVALETIVPGRVRSYRRDEPLLVDPRDSQRRLYPSHAFPRGDSETAVESTFVPVSTTIMQFTPKKSIRVSANDNAAVAMATLGDIEMLFTSDVITASYENGERDVFARAFHLCPQPGCGSVITPSNAGSAGFCMLNPEHDTAQSRLVQLGWSFVTVGIELSASPMIPMGHSLLHGLRAGLEKVAGVLVRDVGEHVTNDRGYVFDAEPGGSGVSELLVDPVNDYQNFRTALEVAGALGSCKCDDGCPHCLFQYGCSERNAPETLSRSALVGIASFSDIRIDPVDIPVGSHQSSSSGEAARRLMDTAAESV